MATVKTVKSAAAAAVETVETIYGVEVGVVENQIPVQLHACYQADLGGQEGFVITADDLDKVGARNWAMVSLSFPEEGEDNEIRVRLGLNMIEGASRKIKTAGSDQVINSYEANIPDASLRGSNQNRMVRLRTNYLLLKDLFMSGVFSKQDQTRIVNWAKSYIEGRSNLPNLTLVPSSEEAVFAFTLKMNFHPDTGLLAKTTPIGIDKFYIREMGLLPSTGMSSFGGNFKIATTTDIVETKLTVKPAAAVVTEDDL